MNNMFQSGLVIGYRQNNVDLNEQYNIITLKLKTSI